MCVQSLCAMISVQLRLKLLQALKAKLSLPQRPLCGGFLSHRTSSTVIRSARALIVFNHGFAFFKKTNLRNRPSQVKFWRNHEESEGGAQTVTASNTDTNTRLEGMKPNSNYLIEVRGYNTAGFGPPSERLMIRTKKARKSFCCCVNEESVVKFEINDTISSFTSSKSSPQDNW